MDGLKTLLLRSPRLTLAVAESLTCGRLQARIGRISGASDFFAGGVTAYSLDQKVKLLGVDAGEAARVKSVSAAIAEQMARGACALFGVDLGAATTGYAEPSPVDGVTQPFAWWALARRKAGGDFDFRNGRVDCPGASRIEAQERVAEAAYAALVAWVAELRA